jgi:hypothetical protein
VDTIKSSAPRAHPGTPTTEERPCFFCLEGWVFLGGLDHDGEEITEAIRCRRCKGGGVLSAGDVR